MICFKYSTEPNILNDEKMFIKMTKRGLSFTQCLSFFSLTLVTDEEQSVLSVLIAQFVLKKKICEKT